MIDELFNRIDHYHLIDWGVVLLGVTGIPGVAERLSHSLVKDFAGIELEKMPIDDPLLDVVVALATDDSSDSTELRENLETVCQAKDIDLDKSKRKWRFVSLEKVLSDLDSDPVYGLINLSEFWSAWGWPTDSPTSLRSDNKISPQDYHSQSNYEYVIKNHREWLAGEFASIQ